MLNKDHPKVGYLITIKFCSSVDVEKAKPRKLCEWMVRAQ